MRYVKTENQDGMFPAMHGEATVRELLEAMPGLQKFVCDPLQAMLMRLGEQAERFTLLAGMPEQFASDARLLTSMLDSIPVFIERGDVANVAVTALDVGRLAEKLAIQSEHEQKVAQVNRNTRILRERRFAIRRRHASSPAPVRGVTRGRAGTKTWRDNRAGLRGISRAT